MSRTYQPKKRKKLRKHGFFTRMQTAHGRKVIKRRQGKQRQRLTV